jgi:hypothetical protein
MTRRLPAAFAIVLFAMSALVVAASAPVQNDTVLLMLRAKEGDVSRVSAEATLTVDANGLQMLFAIKAVNRTSVTAVGPDGTITSRDEIESMEMSIDGTPAPAASPQPPTVVVMRPDGSLVSYSGGSSDSSTGQMHHASRILFSDKPVGVGDTWTREIKANAALGVLAATATFKVLAFEKVGAADTVKISMSFRETGSTTGLSTSGTFWIEKTTGDEVKAEYAITSMPIVAGVVASGTIRQTRLGGGF